MLRLAEQCDTKEWYISFAEQNWRIWPPLRGYFFGRTGLSFGRKKWLAPLKKCPRNAYETHPDETHVKYACRSLELNVG